MEKVVLNIDNWVPKTELGKKVKSGEIATVEELFSYGKKILEPELVYYLLKDKLYMETLEIRMTQRMTDSGRRSSYRVVVAVGDKEKVVGIGVGKNVDLRAAILNAIKNALKNIILVKKGCGSWECKCHEEHSLPFVVEGKEGATRVVLKPAPRGLGLVVNDHIKKILTLAGYKDAWGKVFGNTSNIVSTAYATLYALKSIRERKVGVSK